MGCKYTRIVTRINSLPSFFPETLYKTANKNRLEQKETLKKKLNYSHFIIITYPLENHCVFVELSLSRAVKVLT